MPPRRSIIAHHLILTGYGHWLPNDPRGSGSIEVRQEKLADLGPIHFGRKTVQPSRNVLREFQQAAEPKLNPSIIWFDTRIGQLLAEAVGDIVSRRKYTVYACALLKNHAHFCLRKHRDDAQTMLQILAVGMREALIAAAVVPSDHPVWSNRPYKRFLYMPDDVRGVVAYIEKNPVKEGLPPRRYEFVVAYDNWPFHKQARR